jgi:hypothetical protein
MNIVNLFLLYLLLMTAAMFSCSVQPLTGGSDLPNGIQITGTVGDDDGVASPGTDVRLIPADYDPIYDPPLPEGHTAVTDDRGNYTLWAPDTGLYNILAIQRERRTQALLFSVAVFSRTVAAPQATLKITGSIHVALSGVENVDNGYLYIPGTMIASSVAGSGGLVILNSVPAGTISGIFYRQWSDSAAPVKIAGSVTVPPGGAYTVAYSSWTFSKKLFFNTTASGADVPSMVTGFPVLIRLAAGNFSFYQALPDGADLRFTKSNGTPLPYEIERWDGAAGRAEIWVRVDTVYGNNNNQNIVMYWGASAPSTGSGAVTTSESNGAEVFDTADGFAGVWHLGETGDSVHDATGNGINGKNSGSTTTSGIIGNSRNFSNGNYIRIPSLLNSPSNVSLSAWVRSDTTIARGQDIISIGDAVLIRFDDILGMGTAGCYHNTAIVSDSSYARVKSGQYLAKTGWHYLVFSINAISHEQTLYIDGVQSTVSHDVNQVNYEGLGADTYLGIHGNGKTGFNYVGFIDEVRVNNCPLEPDWVKLCFMNQKEQDALVVW